MTEMIFRDMIKRDVPAIRELLLPWLEEDAGLAADLEAAVARPASSPTRCLVLETGEKVRSACLWFADRSREVTLQALAIGGGCGEFDADVRLLREMILRWADMAVSRATIRIPQRLSPSLIGCLKACGFLYEGIASGCSVDEKPRIRLSKHFFYKTVSQRAVVDFLREFMVSLGYDVRDDDDGFRYRVKEDYSMPFIFSPWHKISESGGEIIMHPPVRVLQWHELETLFFPLRVASGNEKPMLVHLDKKIADGLIALQEPESVQKSLFNSNGKGGARTVGADSVICTWPAGKGPVRKGLPLLFYVNKVGAVGAARVEDAFVGDSESLSERIGERTAVRAEEPNGQAGSSKTKSGKVMVIRFQWYRPLRRVVTLDRIRNLDSSFNPQRTRTLSSALFEAIIASGNPVE